METTDENEEFEAVPDIDEHYFKKLGEVFSVVDTWEEAEVPLPTVIKQEVGESPKNNRKGSRPRTNSERSGGKSKDSKTSTSYDRDRPKRPSPDRGRRAPQVAPWKNPEFNAPPRRSPPRSRPTRELQNQMNNANNSNMAFNNMPNNYPYQMNPMMQNPMHPMQQMMPGNMMMLQQQNFNYMQHQQFPIGSYHAPQQMHDPNFQMSNHPLMAPGTFEVSSENIPRPVPPVSQNINQADVFPVEQATEKASSSKEVNVQEIKKKAFSEGKLNLIDMLKQMHSQKAQEEGVDETTKSVQVKERIQKALQLLDDRNQDETRLPFTFCSAIRSKVPSLIDLTEDSRLKYRSPLLLSDTNQLLMSQANDENVREAMLGNPLRNISGKYFQLARHLGMDLVEISEKVREQVKKEKKETVTRAVDVVHVDISSNVIDKVANKSHQSVQTVNLICDKCELDGRKTFKSKRIGTDEEIPREVPKPVEEPGSFNVSLSVSQLTGISKNQEQILKEFCQAFQLYPESFGEIRKPSRWQDVTENEDSIPFANPENPAFISFSPNRDSPEIVVATSFSERETTSRHSQRESPRRSQETFRSRSPIRRPPRNISTHGRNASRLQNARSRSQSPERRAYSNDSPRQGWFRKESLDRLPSPPPPRYADSPVRSSPEDHYQRGHPRYEEYSERKSRGRVTDRLGEKIESPLRYDDRGGGPSRHYNRPHPYTIPSPLPSPQREFHDDYERNSSRGRQRSRSRSFSQERRQNMRKSRGFSRRGRY